MKLFGRTNKLTDKTKNEENILSLEVVGVVLFQSNLVDTDFSEFIITFTDQNGELLE